MPRLIASPPVLLCVLGLGLLPAAQPCAAQSRRSGSAIVSVTAYVPAPPPVARLEIERSRAGGARVAIDDLSLSICERACGVAWTATLELGLGASADVGLEWRDLRSERRGRLSTGPAVVGAGTGPGVLQLRLLPSGSDAGRVAWATVPVSVTVQLTDPTT